jgi:hypothetical protein
MKKNLVSALAILIAVLALGSSAYASGSTNLEINNAYFKGNNKYTVVIRDIPNIKLGFYINDKNVSFASTTKKGWATFNNISLVNDAKISFTRVFNLKSKIYQKPINYVRYAEISNDRAVFDKTLPINVVKAVTSPPTVASPAVITTPTLTPAPVATPAPSSAASSCTPLTDGGNCYEPGEYCRDSDHGATGVAGDGENIICEDNDGWRWEPN